MKADEKMRKRKERKFGGCSSHSDGLEHFLWLILPHWDEVNRKTHLWFMCAHFAENEGEGETIGKKKIQRSGSEEGERGRGVEIEGGDAKKLSW